MAIKHQFPYFCRPNAPLYFDSAATTHKPEIVLRVMDDFYRTEYATVHRAIYASAATSTKKYANARETVQKFIGAEDAAEIVFTRSATEAINLVARSYGEHQLQEGDVILVPEIEHHANFLPWQMLAKRKKLVLEKIKVDDAGDIDLVALEKQLSPKVKFIALAHVSNVTGGVHPIEKIIPLAHHFGAKVLVDGAQSAAHLPINVQALGVDFFVFSSHKVYGPTGIGVLYGKKELLEGMHPVHFGGDMVEQVSWEDAIFHTPPLRFEAGTPMIAEAIGLAAAIDFISAIGMQTIYEHDQALLAHFLEKSQAIAQFKQLGKPKKQSGIISFSLDGIHPLDLASFLDLEGVCLRTGHLCSQISMQRFKINSTARVSFGIYNTHDEIDLLFNKISKIINYF